MEVNYTWIKKNLCNILIRLRISGSAPCMKLDLCCVVTLRAAFTLIALLPACVQRKQGVCGVAAFSFSGCDRACSLTQLRKREGRPPVFCTSLYETCRTSVDDSPVVYDYPN